MRVLGIIPARYNSSRFPGKPLIDIVGKSMIQRVYNLAKQSNVNRLIVATDDERIVDEVNRIQGEVMLTSDSHLSGTDRCNEVIEKLDQKFDIIVNIQGDEPLINPKQINQLIAAFKDQNVQIATLAKQIEEPIEISDHNTPKVLFDENNIALSFDREINYTTSKYYKHVGLYAYRSAVLNKICQLNPSKKELKLKLEQWRWLENNYQIKIVETNFESYAIDTPEDLKKIIETFGKTSLK